MEDVLPLVGLLALLLVMLRIVTVRQTTPPKPALTWAAQRRADRTLWLDVQRQAMAQWEEACQCPEPRRFKALPNSEFGYWFDTQYAPLLKKGRHGAYVYNGEQYVNVKKYRRDLDAIWTPGGPVG